MKKIPGWAIGLVFGAIALSLIAWGYGTWNDWRNGAITQENSLSSKYSERSARLDTMLSGLVEQIGLADRQIDGVRDILIPVVVARGGNGAVTPTEGRALINALVEAYPNLDAARVYEPVMTWLRAAREAFRNDQEDLLSRVATYNDYLEMNAIRHAVLDAEFPSRRLVARVSPTEVYYGEEALERMSHVIISSGARGAVRTNTLEPMTLPPRAAPPAAAPAP